MLVDGRTEISEPDTVSGAPSDVGSAPESGTRARLTVTDLEVGYKPHEPVLHGVSVDVEPGETVALLGPSGCGKTTLLRAVAGLQRPTGGWIRIGDQLVDDSGEVHVEPHRRAVGMVFQHGALFPHLTVAENVAFGLRGHPAPAQRTAEMLDMVDLSGLAGRLPDSLSGGQRQRVALARALAPNPSVLLLDEPFSALDAGMRNQIRRDVKSILQQIGITTIVVTHDQDEAFVFGDRVALMRDGELVQIGPSTELYDRPRDRWVAGFVGEVNLVPGRMTASTEVPPRGEHGELVTIPRADTVFGQWPATVVESAELATVGSDEVTPPDAEPAEVLIRPEQLELIDPTVDSELPSIAGRVESAEYFGHDVLYQVQSEIGPLLVRTADSHHRPGHEVRVRFRGRAVVVWPGRRGEPQG